MNPTGAQPVSFDVDARPLAHPELVAVEGRSVLPGVTSHLNLQFAAPAGFRPLYLDLHIPDHAAATGPVLVPTAVYAHGGGFVGGTKAMGPWRFLLDAGYAVASIDYRLSGECRFPGPIHDFAAAVRFLRSHAGPFRLDADRSFGFGSSAGAYLAVAVALASDDPAIVGRLGPTPDVSCDLAAVVDHYGPVDFLTLDADARPDTVELADTAGSSADRFLGFLPATRPEQARIADLTKYVTTGSPPVFIAHGDRDRRVGFHQSRRLVDALRRHGVAAEFWTAEGADHGDPCFDDAPIHHATLAFLARTLGAQHLNQDNDNDNAGASI